MWGATHMIDVKQLAEQAGIETDLWQMGAGSLVYSKHCDGIPRAEFEHFVALVLERAAQGCTTLDMESFGVIPIRAVIISNACVDAIRALKPKEPR